MISGVKQERHTVEDAARLLATSVEGVEAAIERGYLSARKLGDGTWSISDDALAEYGLIRGRLIR